MKTLFFECNMGAAGDMLMSALYEVCDQKDLFLKTINEVFAPYQITVQAEPMAKCGILGTHMKICVDGKESTSSHSVVPSLRSFSLHDRIKNASPKNDVPADTDVPLQFTDYDSLLSTIENLSLPEQVKEDAKTIYKLLGTAEAKVHGSTLSQIHFEEPIGLDAIADVIGCALLVYLINPEQICASPIHVGNGFIRYAQGVISIPAPATAELLTNVPFYTGSITGELCTPTGAAILKHYVKQFSSMPQMMPQTIGYGMGKKDFEIANCIRIFLGETLHGKTPSWEEPDFPSMDATDAEQETSQDAASENDMEPKDDVESKDNVDDGFPWDDSVLAISCNIDDMTGESMGLATEILMTAGAIDVYTIAIHMKGNHPGIQLTCICEMEDRDKFTGLFFLHTSARELRYQVYNRCTLESTFVTRSTAYGDIRIKKSSGYGIEKEKPAFEDLKSVVLKNGCAMSVDDIAKSIK